MLGTDLLAAEFGRGALGLLLLALQPVSDRRHNSNENKRHALEGQIEDNRKA